METSKVPYVVEVVELKFPYFVELWSDYKVTWLKSPPSLKLIHTDNTTKSKKKRRKRNGGNAGQDPPGKGA